MVAIKTIIINDSYQAIILNIENARDQQSLLILGIGMEASTANRLGTILHNTIESSPLSQTILKVPEPLKGGNNSKLFS